jgi:hypothetical protein
LDNFMKGLHSLMSVRVETSLAVTVK